MGLRYPCTNRVSAPKRATTRAAPSPLIYLRNEVESKKLLCYRMYLQSDQNETEIGHKREIKIKMCVWVCGKIELLFGSSDRIS